MSENSNSEERTILETIPDGVIAFDLSGKITLVNKAAEHLLGISRANVLGRVSDDLVELCGEGSKKWVALLHKLFANQDELKGRSLTEQIDIDHKRISVQVFAVPGNEKLTGLISVLQDITQEVAASHVRERLILDSWHDLKSRVLSVSSIIELVIQTITNSALTLEERRQILLDDEVAAEMSPKQRLQLLLDNRSTLTLTSQHLKLLELAHHNGMRLPFLVDDIYFIMNIENEGLKVKTNEHGKPIRFDISETGIGDIPLRTDVIDLHQHVNDAIKSLKEFHGSNGRVINIKSEFSQDVSTIKSDYRIRFVLDELLTNACRYTPDKGSITIRVVRDESSVRMDVIDNGLGIPEDEQPYIFNMGFRGKNDGVVYQDGTGIGLGLSIVEGIVGLNHGKISVQSQPGEGTTFTVWLPFA